MGYQMIKWFAKKIAEYLQPYIKPIAKEYVKELVVNTIKDVFDRENDLDPDRHCIYGDWDIQRIRRTLEHSFQRNQADVIQDRVKIEAGKILPVIESEEFLDKIVDRILRKQIK